MSAYVVVHATPKDADKMQEYAAGAGPAVTKHGGEVVCRGPSEVLHGESAHQIMVVLKFKNKKDAQDWYNSADYQAIIATRNQAMDSVFILGGE